MPVQLDMKNLLSFHAKVLNGMTEPLLQGAKDIVQLASELAPKDTEALSQSGKAEIIDKNSVEISFGNGLPDQRAAAQEYGTVFMPAQPYLTPAMRQVDVLHYIKLKLGLR